MGVHLKYISSDELFNRTHHSKIVINELSNRTIRDKAIVNSLLMLEVGEAFDNIPSCQCGALSMNIYKGVRCSKCDSVAEEVVSTDLDNKMWVRAPIGVPALMNPMLWFQLQTYLERSTYKFNLLQWLTDPTYKPKVTKFTKSISMMLQRLDELGLNIRDYQHFYDNFDTYIHLLLTEKEFRRSSDTTSVSGEALLKLFKENRDIVWQQYIQIPNKAVTIIENSNGKKWIDPSTPKLLRAIRLMVGIDNEDNVRGGISTKTKLARASKFLSYFSEYQSMEINPKFLGSKPGEIRKHVIATRSNFTGRFVVTAINGPHHYSEVRLPWIGFMGMFAPQIRAKLYHKYGLSSSRVNEIMTKYQKVYHPKLHEIMLELIDESTDSEGNKGITIIINRNPSLKHGSIVRLRIPSVVGVKTDVRDMSASTSGKIAAWYNGDFDGDQETFLAVLDKRMSKAFEPFDAKYSVGDLINVYEADGVTSISKQTAMALANTLLLHDEQQPTKAQATFMSRFVA